MAIKRVDRIDATNVTTAAIDTTGADLRIITSTYPPNYDVACRCGSKDVSACVGVNEKGSIIAARFVCHDCGHAWSATGD